MSKVHIKKDDRTQSVTITMPSRAFIEMVMWIEARIPRDGFTKWLRAECNRLFPAGEPHHD